MKTVYDLTLETAQFELMVESMEYTSEGVLDALKSVADRVGAFVLRYHSLHLKVLTWFRTNVKWLTNKVIEDAVATAFEKATEYGVKLHDFRFLKLYNKVYSAIQACLESAKSGKFDRAKLEAANLGIRYKELNATYSVVSIRKNTVMKDLETRKKAIEILENIKAEELVKATEDLIKKASSDSEMSKEQVKYINRVAVVAQRFASLVLTAMEDAKGDMIRIQNKIGAKAPEQTN